MRVSQSRCVQFSVLALTALLLAAAPSHAQTAPEPGAAPEAAPAGPEASGGEASDGAAEEAPPDPLLEGLSEPGIDADELALRLIPLTAAQLETLAGDWLAIVQQKTAEVVGEQVRINSAAAEESGEGTEESTGEGVGESAEEESRDRLTELTEERRALFDRYTTVVDAWELKGGDPAAVAGFRTYRSSVLVEETRNTDWRTLLARAWAWTTDEDGGIALARNIGIVVASFIGLLVVARIVRALVRRWAGHIPNISKLLAAFVAIVAYWLTLAVGLMVVLAGLGVNITPLFALVGGASFILAFAMQDTLGNLAAGLMIMINQPFDEGDEVDIGGVVGTVRDVSIVSTTVVTPDNQVVVVPNSSVWGNVITNSTASETRRVDLAFAVPNETSIAVAQAALERTVRAHPLVLEDPAPVIRANALGESTVTFVVWPWVRSGDYSTVFWDLTHQVKEALDRLGEGEAEQVSPPPSAAPPPPAGASEATA